MVASWRADIPAGVGELKLLLVRFVLRGLCDCQSRFVPSFSSVNSYIIQADQHLRVANMADTLRSNPYYFLQKRFKRLYFKFQPQRYYWCANPLACR